MSRISFTFSLLLFLVVATFAAELPVTDVVLYSSGVGYLQRTGSVTGNDMVTLSFKAEQINDLLKSLVLMDLDGGKVGAITYGARDPIGKTLATYAIDLTDNPSIAALLSRLRGVTVTVTATNTITGKVLGVETKTRRVKDEEIVTTEVLNLVTATGIRSVRLEEIPDIQINDDRLNKELRDALDVLASGLDNQRRPVSIAFTGEGKRRVKVGYVAEMPIWKTSYRLVFGENEALMQGWAIVENTSDTDWHNVRLSLVSGRPVSFIQDLYSPIYVPRPVYEPARFASLRPVTYEPVLEMDGAALPPTFSMNARAGVQMRNDVNLPRPAPTPTTVNGEVVGQLRTYSDTVQAAASAKDIGQGFQYTIKDLVTLPRQQSAMLPILAEGVGAWKVTISSPSSEHPMYGMRLKNTTGIHLMGGPITVYTDDVYAGDAVLEDLQPGEDRLISYAVDLGMKVKREDVSESSEILAFKVVRGMLQVSRKYRRTATYIAAIADGKDRKLVIEHPLQTGWELVEPEKADEKTKDMYRFIRQVAAAEGLKLQVIEERKAGETLAITSMNTDALVGFITTGKMSDEVKAAMQRVVTMQRNLNELRYQRTLAEQEINSITVEQNRIRANMNALNANSDLYKRYVAKLGEQETRIEALRTRIEDLTQRESALRKELNDYVAGLNLD